MAKEACARCEHSVRIPANVEEYICNCGYHIISRSSLLNTGGPLYGGPAGPVGGGWR